MWFVPLIAAGISAGAGIYGQEKNRREQERLNKSNQAIANQNMLNNRRLEDQSKFGDYPYAGVPFRSMNFANGGDIDKSPKDVVYGNIHYTSKFKPNRFNLAKNGAVSGKWSAPGARFIKGVGNVDVILPLLDIIRQEYEIQNSNNPNQTREKLNKESKRVINSLSDPNNPLYKEGEYLANGGMLNVGNDLIGLNSQGGTSGSHEQGDNIHLLNSSGQSVKIEPGEVITDGNYALSKRNPIPGDSFADRYLRHKGESVSLLAASKRLPDIVKSNELKRLSEIEDAKAKLVKPEQEMFNETNNQPGYAGIKTSEMQAGGTLDRLYKNDRFRNSLVGLYDDEILQLHTNIENEIAKSNTLPNKLTPKSNVSRIDSYSESGLASKNKLGFKSSTVPYYQPTISGKSNMKMATYKNGEVSEGNKTDTNSLSFKEGIGMYGSDIINAGLAIYESTRKPLKYPGAQLSPIPSVRRLNPYGRIGNISNEVGKAVRDIDLSTSNSQVARAAKQSVVMAGMDAKNKFISDIEDKNIAIDNQSAQLNANINATNAAAINNNLIGKYSVDSARRDNLTNMYSQIAANISNKYIDQLNFKKRAELDKEINKINTESNYKIAELNAKTASDTEQMYRNMMDSPEAEMRMSNANGFKAFREFIKKYPNRDVEELTQMWIKSGKHLN